MEVTATKFDSTKPTKSEFETRPTPDDAASLSTPAAKSAADITQAAPGASGSGASGKRGDKVRAMLRAKLGEEVFTSWFKTIEFDSFDNGVVRASVPVNFLKKWIASHYLDELLACCQAEFKGAQKVEVALREPGGAAAKAHQAQANLDAMQAERAANGGHDAASRPNGPRVAAPLMPQITRLQAGGFEGSPLDPRCTFDSFVVGRPNRIAHAAAVRVAESLLREKPSFNPLFIHASVGLGKTHLLQAIALEVIRRTPDAKVLYLTAEGFRYRFVEALRGQDPLSFREKFRQVDLLLIDDLEFMQGEKTEQEFDHIVNALLDGGKQLVVASARPPALNERLNERMRSRLTGGLAAEIGTFDQELRLKVLEQRMAEKKALDPSFELAPGILDILAERLTDSGRELEGAITRLFASWQYMRAPVTVDIAETVIRDLLQGAEPRRIKIEDILRIVSRHYGVSRSDLLSQRRHRSVVWPRQIGMYLAKQMTQRSLPEIGRRFGNRDHTTVLHAIRKIDGQLKDNVRLKEEIEDLKKILSH